MRFDNNKYSVAASAVGRPVEVHAYADRIVIRQDGRIVGEHPRSFSRSETIYDPWHYVPVLARKPGALRNGAPFKDWVLPAAMERVRRKLAGADDGNRQMVDILTAVLTDGLPAVEAIMMSSKDAHRAEPSLNRAMQICECCRSAPTLRQWRKHVTPPKHARANCSATGRLPKSKGARVAYPSASIAPRALPIPLSSGIGHLCDVPHSAVQAKRTP